MAFIRNPKMVRVGDRIRITRPIEMFQGTYTTGHEFVIIGSGERGFNIRDDEGREIRECAMIQDCFELVAQGD